MAPQQQEGPNLVCIIMHSTTTYWEECFHTASLIMSSVLVIWACLLGPFLETLRQLIGFCKSPCKRTQFIGNFQFPLSLVYIYHATSLMWCNVDMMVWCGFESAHNSKREFCCCRYFLLFNLFPFAVMFFLSVLLSNSKRGLCCCRLQIFRKSTLNSKTCACLWRLGLTSALTSS